MIGLPDLPKDLILDTLSRLPTKTLCKLKSVCKDWHNLISSNKCFKNLQRCHYSLKSPRLISYEIYGFNDVQKGDYTVCLTTADIGCGKVCDEFEVKIGKEGDSFCQVTSCRGLVCLFTNLEIVVCNPSNHQFIALRDCGTNYPNSVGLGYVASAEEYKIVRLYRAYVNGFERLGCQIFSFNDASDDYTVFQNVVPEYNFKPFDFLPLDDHLPLCVNAVMYWIVKNCRRDKDNIAYYLDLEGYCSGQVRCPKLEVMEKLLLSYENIKLLEVQGLLCLQCSLRLGSTIVLFVLKDVKFSIWEKLCVISLFPVVRRLGEAQVLGSVPSDCQEDELVIADISSSNVYRVKGKGMKRSEIQDQRKGRFRILHFDGLFSFKTR